MAFATSIRLLVALAVTNHMTLEQLTAGGGRSVSTMRWKTAGLTARLGLRVAAPAADPPRDPEAAAK